MRLFQLMLLGLVLAAPVGAQTVTPSDGDRGRSVKAEKCGGAVAMANIYRLPEYYPNPQLAAASCEAVEENCSQEVRVQVCGSLKDSTDEKK